MLDDFGSTTPLNIEQVLCRRIEIIVVTDGFTNEQANRLGLTATTKFDEALSKALARHGNQAQIGVITKGADIMGRFKPSEQ